ncbi:aromatase/cyclase [Streptomyces sp. NPDC060027]|uniref:aromatase/cyclase n=1 Tax=Streptomyces sp. NPDC060027 TaxID=3347040 RepID=UPI0036B14850
MSAERVHRTTHQVIVAAPAGVAYGLISDAPRWPLFLPPTVHVEQLDFDGDHERLRMWATANGHVTSWTSRRTLDPQRRRITFRQELPAAPLRSMTGTWTVEALGADRSRLTLQHDFTVTGGHREDVAWVRRATDTNTRTQLESLRALAERWGRLDDLVLSFEDTVRVPGPAELVYDFLYRIGDWPEMLPHVTRLDFTEDEPGIQSLSMDTRTPDGRTHTTRSVRVCFPHAGRIVYKQTATAPLIAAHTGEWSVVPDEKGVTLIAQHHVVLREEDITTVLGEHADVAGARRHLRQALGRTSTAVLDLAGRHARNAVTLL